MDWTDQKAFIDDLITSSVDLFRDNFGTDGTEAGTIGKSAQWIYDQIVTLSATSPETGEDLLRAAAHYKGAVLTYFVCAKLNDLCVAFDQSQYLRSSLLSNDRRVSENFQDLFAYLDPAAVFMEQRTITALGKLATFDYLTATTLTYTDGTEVDTDKYGKHNLVIKNTSGSVWGGVATEFTITCQKIDGTDQDRDVTMPASSIDGFEVDIGTHDTDMYVGVSAAVIKSGSWTAGRQIEAHCEEERIIT